MVKSVWIVFVLFFSGTLFAQDLTGIWRGTFYNPSEYAMYGSKYRYEVQINNKGRDAKGVTYSYQTTRFYGKASLVGVWSPGAKELIIQEDRMLDLKIADGGEGCLMTCYLSYRKEAGKEYLEGTYTSTSMNNKNKSCGGGKVFLEKVPDTDFELEDFLVKKPTNTPQKGKTKPGQEEFIVKKAPSNNQKPQPSANPPVTKSTPAPNNKPVEKKPESKPKETEPLVKKETPPAEIKKPQNEPNTEAPKPKVPASPAPAVLKERKNELFKTITTSERFVEISFYDNGEIDGDTISIFNNNRLIASKKGLTSKPVVVKIELSNEDPQQDVVMVAENLGSIPPNTALMIVNAGNQRYTLNITSTEQKNAMVRFKYQPQ